MPQDNMRHQVNDSRHSSRQRCGKRGNRLTLIHGLEKNAPAYRKLRGQEFKDFLNKLKEIHSGVPEVRSPNVQRSEIDHARTA